MKVKFKQLTLRNFMSMGNAETVVELDTNLITLIRGMNLDTGNGSTSRNGTGKSVLFHALTWCLFDENVTNIKKDDFINIRNKKDMVVTVTFEAGDDEYRIIRGRKPNVVVIERNGVPYTPARDIQEEIVDILGMDFLSWTTITMLTTDNEHFLNMKPAPQRDYMEKILSLHVLSTRAKVLKDRQKDLTVAIKVEEAEIQSALVDNNKTKVNIERQEEQATAWDQSESATVVELKEQLSMLVSVDRDREEKLIAQRRSLEDQLKACTAALERARTAETLKGKASVWAQEKEVEKAALEAQLAELSSIDVDAQMELIRRFEELQDVVKLSRTSLQSAQRVADLQAKADKWDADHAKEREELSNKLVELVAVDIDAQRKRLQELQQLKTKAADLSSQITFNGGKYEVATDKLEKLVAEISTLEAGQCPYCNQSHVDNEKLSDLKFESAELGSTVDNLTVLINDAIAAEAKVEKEIAEFVTEGLLQEDALAQIEFMRGTTAHALENLDMKTNPYHDQIPTDSAVQSVEEAETQLQRDEEALREFDTEHTLFDEGGLIKIGHEINTIKQALAKGFGENPYLEQAALYSDAPSEADATTNVTEARTALTEFDLAHQLMTESQLDLIAAQIPEIEKQLSTRPVNPYREQIEMLRSSIKKVDTRNIDKMNREADHLKVLIKLLTDSKSFVRRHLIDQYIPVINKQVNDYLEKIEAAHRIRINSDLSIDIIYMGQMISYGNLSRGERLRVNFAVSMAFKDFLGQSGIGCNLLCIDEVLDCGGDTQFMMNIFGLIKKMDESVFLISHREDIVSEVDQTLVVTKKNGFTSLHMESA